MKLAAAVEGELFYPPTAKRCRQVPSLSLSVTAALPAVWYPAMVAPAPLMTCWLTAGVVLVARTAGQAATGWRVQLGVEALRQRGRMGILPVEAAVALEDQGKQENTHTGLGIKVVTAVWALNRAYLVPPIIMAAAAAAAAAA